MLNTSIGNATDRKVTGGNAEHKEWHLLAQVHRRFEGLISTIIRIEATNKHEAGSRIDFETIDFDNFNPCMIMQTIHKAAPVTREKTR
jgi:hypothetical protein